MCTSLSFLLPVQKPGNEANPVYICKLGDLVVAWNTVKLSAFMLLCPSHVQRKAFMCFFPITRSPKPVPLELYIGGSYLYPKCNTSKIPGSDSEFQPKLV